MSYFPLDTYTDIIRLEYDLADSLRNDEHSDIVKKIYYALEKHDLFDGIKYTNSKSESNSDIFREYGNTKLYTLNDYMAALMYYNRAIATAPNYSKAQSLSYYSRSILFFNMKKFQSCLNDVNTCLNYLDTYNFNGDKQTLKDHLKQLKRKCLSKLNKESHVCDIKNNHYCKYIFSIPEKNRIIPCATKKVELVKNEGKLIVIAKEDIKPFEVIAIEETFLASPIRDNCFIFCDYCMNFRENVIPCDYCCDCLYCNESCKQNSWNDYHKYMCPINFAKLHMFPSDLVIIKGALSSKYKHLDWKNKININNNSNQNSKKNSAIDNETDWKNIFTSFPMEREKHFGRMFKSAIYTAFILYGITNYTSYFPETKESFDDLLEKLMFLFLNANAIPMSGGEYNKDSLYNHGTSSFGLFEFIGKIKHSCNPNVINFGFDNEVVLLSLIDIPEGTDITIPYKGHYCRKEIELRRKALYFDKSFLCNCEACINNWTACEESDDDTYHDELHKKISTLLQKVKISETPMLTKYFKQLFNLYNKNYQRNPKSKVLMKCINSIIELNNIMKSLYSLYKSKIY